MLSVNRLIVSAGDTILWHREPYELNHKNSFCESTMLFSINRKNVARQSTLAINRKKLYSRFHSAERINMLLCKYLIFIDCLKLYSEKIIVLHLCNFHCYYLGNKISLVMAMRKNRLLGSWLLEGQRTIK